MGAPLVGWVADAFGARWAMGVAALSGLAAAIVGWRYLSLYHRSSQMGAFQENPEP